MAVLGVSKTLVYKIRQGTESSQLYCNLGVFKKKKKWEKNAQQQIFVLMCFPLFFNLCLLILNKAYFLGKSICKRASFLHLLFLKFEERHNKTLNKIPPIYQLPHFCSILLPPSKTPLLNHEGTQTRRCFRIVSRSQPISRELLPFFLVNKSDLKVDTLGILDQ